MTALAGALDDLAAQLARSGAGRLIIRTGDTVEELARLARELGAEAVFANHSEGSRADEIERAAGVDG